MYLLSVVRVWSCWESPAAASPSRRGSRRRPTLKIVEQVQIDQNGMEIKSAQGAAPVDPAGDGKATCPPVSIAMAGALNGPDAALGINIKDGVQLAIDKHNAANPGCQVQLKPFDTEGDPQKATAIAPQIFDCQYTIGLVGPRVLGRDQGHRHRLRPGRPGGCHGVRDQPHTQPERLEDLLPRAECGVGRGRRGSHQAGLVEDGAGGLGLSPRTRGEQPWRFFFFFLCSGSFVQLRIASAQRRPTARRGRPARTRTTRPSGRR